MGKKKKVDKAMRKAAESLWHLEKSGDVDGFVIIAQKKMSRKTDGVAALLWRENREDAERDLEAYAASHGMKKVES